MSDLKITNLYKRYGSVEILKDVNLEIKSGEFIVFVGPSGCGKSTLLRCISGLETISAGTLEIDGRVVNDVAPSKRGIAIDFLEAALLDLLVQRLLEGGDGGVSGALMPGAQHHLEAALGRDFGDARTHDPRTENAHALDRHAPAEPLLQLLSYDKARNVTGE